ncbi:MAG: hypothetical protein AAB966_02045 [Patescibacteria group bacterium]
MSKEKRKQEPFPAEHYFRWMDENCAGILTRFEKARTEIDEIIKRKIEKGFDDIYDCCLDLTRLRYEEMGICNVATSIARELTADIDLNLGETTLRPHSDFWYGNGRRIGHNFLLGTQGFIIDFTVAQFVSVPDVVGPGDRLTLAQERAPELFHQLPNGLVALAASHDQIAQKLQLEYQF